MLDLPFRSALELAAEIRARRVGCRELLDLYLKRVERYNPKLNAVVVIDAAGARRRADAADAALARGDIWGPLHGVPMTIKESYDVAGMPTTWGVPEFKEHRAERNALAVDRMLAAGVVLFGKTNVPLFLGDWQSYNEIYGTTNNPWDVTRTPGGSSGGSAAALAAGLTGIDAGSDIGSSIRNPVHFCGVYGHKPSWGILSPRGHALDGRVAASDISVIGPLARSAGDLEVALSAMAGPDEIDGAGWRLELKRPRQERLADYRIAVFLDTPEAEVDRGVTDEIQKLADFLAKAGATMSDTARPDIEPAAVKRLFERMLFAAMSGRQPEDVFRANLAKAAVLAPDDFSMAAQVARGSTLHHRDWLIDNEQRHRMRLKWAEFFRDYDLLLCPPITTAAFPHDQEGTPFLRSNTVNGKTVPMADQLFWAGYSGLFHLPSTVAPAGQTKDGLPVGVQIVGPQYDDLTCIHLARLLEREFRGFVPPPGYARND